ncbi:MAG: DUF6492 family protein [Candidatus Ferrigenium altingense]|jgi:hypothetical protein
MSSISIFCKSYRNDLERVVKLVESIRRFNVNSLPLYIAVPRSDLEIFRERIGTDITWLTDEEIIGSNPDIDLNKYLALAGQHSQQIVKAEFWRINPADNYVCVDSDMRFIRNFYRTDFLSSDGQPYTILHEGKAFLEFCLSNKLGDVIANFEQTAQTMQQRFNRDGPLYNFGPFPVIWNAKVWRMLADTLHSDGSNILDALISHPHEASWYGETLLKYRPIALLPKEPVFKAYLFLEEYERDQRARITEQELARLYLGVVYQSNWYPKRLQPLKRLAYKIKRRLKNHL